MPRLLLIVARDQPTLFEYARQGFDEVADDIEVLVDRRTGKRRQRVEAPPVERRRADRRQAAATDDRLRALGWAIVHPA